MQSCYDIIHEPSFDADIKRISGGPAAGDDLVFALVWALARNPRVGKKLDDDECVWWRSCTDHAIGKVIVFYSFNEPKQEVYLLSALHSKKAEV
jgi:hypothetical protein